MLDVRELLDQAVGPGDLEGLDRARAEPEVLTARAAAAPGRAASEWTC